MNLFRQQSLPQPLQKVQREAVCLKSLLELKDNRSLPGSLEIRLGASDLLDYLKAAYPPKEPEQMEMFSPE
jgi:hypothetical protein